MPHRHPLSERLLGVHYPITLRSHVAGLMMFDSQVILLAEIFGSVSVLCSSTQSASSSGLSLAHSRRIPEGMDLQSHHDGHS